MRTPYSQFTSLIVIVAALALVGGIAIVLVTSRDSLELAPEIWFGGASPVAQLTTAPATDTPQAVTATPEPPTATVPAATSTLLPTPTLEPSLTPTPDTGLPQGVTALAEVALDAAAARLRDAPNGRIIGALLRGTPVQVLTGREVLDGITWVEIRADTGETGWMAEDLLLIVTPAAPSAGASPTLDPASVTALPTLPGGVRGTAVVSIGTGLSARLRDAPAGRVIGGLPDGTPLQVLQGSETRDGLVWIEVQDDTGQSGWISEDLVVYTSTSS